MLAAGRLPGGVAIRGHVVDPDDPGQGRCADLDLVEPAQQLVQRPGHLLDVEDDRGDGADRGAATGHQPAAPHQGGRHGQQVGELDLREPDHPQPQGVQLGVEAAGDGVVDALPAP